MCALFYTMKRSEKPFVVEDLTARIKDAKSVVVVDYQGIATKSLNELRQKIKEAGGTFTVAKNTLLNLAFAKTDIDKDIEKGLTGPTAVVFANEDEIAPLQIIGKQAQEAGLPKFKFGIFGGDFLDSEKLLSLSKLPGRQVLLGQLVGTIAGPAYSLVEILNGNLQKLIYILNEKAKKGGE